MSIIVNPPPAGGGGGASTIADGADVTQGAKADSAWDGSAASPTQQSILKRIAVNLGLPSDAAWSGSGDGGAIGILKRIANFVTAIGAIGDAAWASGNGTLVAILKAIAGTNGTVAGAVASSRMNSNIQRTGSTTSVAIANAATDSAAIDIAAMITGGFIIPSAFTGTSVSYKVSYTTSGHQPLYDQFGNQVTTPVAVNRAFPFPAEAAGFASLIIVSSGAEGASRTIQLYRKG